MQIAPEFLNVTFLQVMECFVIYSILGWLVESAYMSICEKKLTNRGFGLGPFCPIYGVGASVGAILLSPFRASIPLLYIVSAVSATIFEYLVGRLMQLSLGDFWWDYTEKPFNYKGIICLESTLAWGMYGIIVVKFLHPYVLHRTLEIPRQSGMVFSLAILLVYFFDFSFHVLLALHIDAAERAHERTVGAMEYAKERTVEAASVMREKTTGAMEHARERTVEAASVMREKTTGAMEHARERTVEAASAMREKTSGAVEKAREKTAEAATAMREKTSEAVGRQRRAVSRRRQAVLNWYRDHRWR
ncbi:MAG: hypothetical protein K6E84_04275 [Lachnospiraceae bacterium]|nr:hypothetical protein [Lachnospiraceae bacterium]